MTSEKAVLVKMLTSLKWPKIPEKIRILQSRFFDYKKKEKPSIRAFPFLSK